MIKGRYAIICKTIALVASLSLTLYLSYSAILSAVASTEIFCYSANNIESPYAADCCYDEDESCLGCCYQEVPLQNRNPLLVSLDNGSYRNSVCDLQMLIPNSPVLAEFYDINFEERFIPQDIIYFIFKPPQVQA